MPTGIIIGDNGYSLITTIKVVINKLDNWD